VNRVAAKLLQADLRVRVVFIFDGQLRRRLVPGEFFRHGEFAAGDVLQFFSALSQSMSRRFSPAFLSRSMRLILCPEFLACSGRRRGVYAGLPTGEVFFSK
jgi:hypothetical protein